MISYIKGCLANISEDGIVVETGGMGFHIHMPLSAIDGLPRTGSEVQIYTSLQVREDSMNLYGFLNRQDMQMFIQLLGVNGIGPKAALGILSTLSTSDLHMAIISGDAKSIAKAPGIGPKTAQRVILDLKDRIKIEDILPGTAAGDAGVDASFGNSGAEGVAGEAVEALVALGYSPMEARKAVHQVKLTEDMTSEAVLKASLRHLAF